jgi:hypothetical protein
VLCKGQQHSKRPKLDVSMNLSFLSTTLNLHHQIPFSAHFFSCLLPLPSFVRILLNAPLIRYHLKAPLLKPFKTHPPFSLCHPKLHVVESSRVHPPFPFCDPKPPLPSLVEISQNVTTPFTTTCNLYSFATRFENICNYKTNFQLFWSFSQL